MKKDVIRSKLANYHHKESDTILLEVIRGTPRTAKGGEWIETTVEELEGLTESVDFSPSDSGYNKYLDKWFAEGLITAKEKATGKS